MTNKYEWSKLYLDYITHYGDTAQIPYRRATVCKEFEGWYTLSKWSNHCGFSPETKGFDTMEEAKQAGEDWVNKGI